MAKELTQQQIGILATHANNGDRYAYWSYLSQLGDPYAKLALGVVTNETWQGQVANLFAAARGQDKGVTIDYRANWKIGSDLMA